MGGDPGQRQQRLWGSRGVKGEGDFGVLGCQGGLGAVTPAGLSAAAPELREVCAGGAGEGSQFWTNQFRGFSGQEGAGQELHGQGRTEPL